MFNKKKSRSLLLGTLPLMINFDVRSKVVNRIDKNVLINGSSLSSILGFFGFFSTLNTEQST